MAVFNKSAPIIVMNSRFVILTHDFPHLHWDLLLEEADSLRTWRLLKEPIPPDSVPAEALPAHRKHYLTYEGPVSGDRGRVAQWDSGTFELIETKDESLRARLIGSRIRATVCIRLIDAETGSWELQFETREDDPA